VTRILIGVVISVSLSWLAGAPTRAAGPSINVPRGPAIVIDARIDEAEWRGAAVQTWSDGRTLRLRHDGTHLFLGITASSQGFPSLCIATGDSIHVLHASAALGHLRYRSSPDGWTTHETAFVYGMRTPDLTEQAAAERREYLARHGWVGSTFRMGDGRVQELQVAIILASRAPRVALGYFAIAGNSGSVVKWPSSLDPSDGCINRELVTGNVPSLLGFDPASWASLRLMP
jgi:hypothetical protein